MSRSAPGPIGTGDRVSPTKAALICHGGALLRRYGSLGCGPCLEKYFQRMLLDRERGTTAPGRAG